MTVTAILQTPMGLSKSWQVCLFHHVHVFIWLCNAMASWSSVCINKNNILYIYSLYHRFNDVCLSCFGIFVMFSVSSGFIKEFYIIHLNALKKFAH